MYGLGSACVVCACVVYVFRGWYICGVCVEVCHVCGVFLVCVCDVDVMCMSVCYMCSVYEYYKYVVIVWCICGVCVCVVYMCMVYRCAVFEVCEMYAANV